MFGTTTCELNQVDEHNITTTIFIYANLFHVVSLKVHLSIVILIDLLMNIILTGFDVYRQNLLCFAEQACEEFVESPVV